MKKRKNVLIVMALLYIIAAVCAVVIFLTRPIGKIEHKQEDSGHTGGNVQALAHAQTETKPQTVQTETQSLVAWAPMESMPAQMIKETASESQPDNPDTGLRVSEAETETSRQPANEQTQPMAQVQPRTQAQTAAPDSPLLAGEYEALYSAVSRRGSMNMRKAPDNSGAVVFCIPQDGTCEVLLEDVEGWMLVRYNGYIGFVYESFLEEI